MSQRMHGFRVLVPLLGVAVLSLMAFGAAGAQAEVGANWMVAGANITKTVAVTENRRPAASRC